MSDAGGAGGQLPAANWYADPLDPNKLRWWDGAKWTASVRDIVLPELGAVRSREQLRSTPVDEHPVGVSGERRQEVTVSRPTAFTGEIVLAPNGPTPSAASLSALVADLGQDIAPTQRPSTTASVRVQWVDHHRMQPNGPATASLITGMVSVLVNPILLVSLVAWITGGIGLRRGGGARRAGWGIALGVLGALVWGGIAIFVIVHPVALKFLWWNVPSAVSVLKSGSPAIATAYSDSDLAWFLFDTCEMADAVGPAIRTDATASMTDPGAISPTTEAFADLVSYTVEHDDLLAALGSPIADDASSELATAKQVASTGAYTAVCPGVMAELGYAATLAG